jgi:hypothetical protein
LKDGAVPQLLGVPRRQAARPGDGFALDGNVLQIAARQRLVGGDEERRGRAARAEPGFEDCGFRRCFRATADPRALRRGRNEECGNNRDAA